MGRYVKSLHALTSQAANDANKRFRRVREIFVPSRIAKILQEEGRLSLDFDSATTPEERREADAALTRKRLLILRMIGWPREPTLKGHLPRAMDGIGNANPLSDLDIGSMPDASAGSHQGAPGDQGKTPDET